MRSGLRHTGRARYWGPLAIVLAVAFALRLWGIKQGLPYAYNVDEHGHFVSIAVAMFSGGLNPHYFVNPPAFTYLLHLVFAVWLGGGGDVSREFALHPGDLFLAGRVTAALLGTVSVWLLYLVGVRLFSRGVGLLAAALMAVAFLPVFYAHLALNDVPTLAPLTLSLLGTAGVVGRGRALDYLLAGTGLGLACATKYTAGIAILPLLAAAVAQYLAVAPDARRHAATGIMIAAGAALGAFVISNPFSVLDFQHFHSELVHQSSYTERSGALWTGGPRESAILYYLWSFTWGLGWVPALAALGGAVTVWRWDRSPIGRWLGWLLVPAPLLFLAFMGLQGRYFGRWLLPIFPIVCLLAAFFALQAAGSLARRLPRLRGALVALAVVALCAQGATYSIHSGIVLARADTRNLTRAWMLAHIPAGTSIVLEPVAPNSWLLDLGHAVPTTPGGTRWLKYPALRVTQDPATGTPERPGKVVLLEDYERTLGPALIEYYERHGYCWVVSGSTQSGRAFVNPRVLPHAIAYYKALEQQGNVAYHVSPYAPGKGPVAFNFDWSFDYYPLAYARPGPEMTVYRLRGGRCGRGMSSTGRHGTGRRS